MSGHTYAFRCKAHDKAGNVGVYSANGDASTTIDPTSQPPEPWWTTGYSGKRRITILNNMPSTTIPAGYPIKLVLNSTTNPTAAEVFNGANRPCDATFSDLRVVYNNTTDLDRILLSCSATEIVLWFRTQESIAGGASNQNYFVYFGNSNPASTLANPRNVWIPFGDATASVIYYMRQNPERTLYDSGLPGGFNCNLAATTNWTSAYPAKFLGALEFGGGTDGATVVCNDLGLLNFSSFTTEFFFRSTGGNLWGHMAGQMGSAQRWLIDTVDNKPHFQIWSPSGSGSVTVNQAYNDDQWHHLAATLDNTTMRLYIDGVLRAESIASGAIRSANVPLTIGSSENIARTFAQITGFRYRNGALNNLWC